MTTEDQPPEHKSGQDKATKSKAAPKEPDKKRSEPKKDEKHPEKGSRYFPKDFRPRQSSGCIVGYTDRLRGGKDESDQDE